MDDLAESLTASELDEWAAFERLEPFTPVRTDVAGALVAATIANAHRDPQRRSEPFGVRDFLPAWDRPAPRQMSDDELLRRAEAITRLLGGHVPGDDA